MRTQINKLNIGHSTKAERRFMELLKELHIPFRTKVKIGGREIDFLIGKIAIEIDGHEQDVQKNYMLIKEGFHPIHLHNRQITPQLKEWLNKIYASTSRNKSMGGYDLNSFRRPHIGRK